MTQTEINVIRSIKVANIELNPNTGPPGTNVTIESSGFPSDATVDIVCGDYGMRVGVLAQADTNEEGSFARAQKYGINIFVGTL